MYSNWPVCAREIFLRQRGVLLNTDGPFVNVLEIRPPMDLGGANVDLLVTALDDILGELAIDRPD